MSENKQDSGSVIEIESDYKPGRSLRSILIGNPLTTAEVPHQTIGKAIGLAVFASDALSSTAYSTQELMFILAAAGIEAFGYVMPLTICVVVLLAIITVSYEQTIHAYPDGGGAYIVSRDNLGHIPAQTAAAALLTDYILTVAVSTSSGVAQITSAFPGLYQYRVIIALLCVFFVMMINLRGVKESGSFFAVPTYFFLISMVVLAATGLFKYFSGTLGTVVDPPELEVNGGFVALTTFLVLKAFASGTTALTGVEAISNGITAFKEPRSKNAGQTLVIMSAILGSMLLAVAFLSYKTGVIPSELEANLSQVARTVYGSRNILYYITVTATIVILIMAANTAFADFPRLGAMVATDGFLPRQFALRGSRLVYSHGIVILSVVASLLIVIFQASVNRLIPLYAVGVFISFTMSQFGMAKRWHKIGKLKEGEVIHERGSVLAYDPRWHVKMYLNGFGALCTLVITFVFGATKFADGAWVILILTPLLVVLFSIIHNHYKGVAEKLSLSETEVKNTPITKNQVFLLIGGVHQGTIKAIRYAKSLSDDAAAVYVEVEPENTEKIKKNWETWGGRMPLEIIESPYRLLLEPMISFIDDAAEKLGPDDVITVIMPQFVSKSHFADVLHANSADAIRSALSSYPNLVVVDVPFNLD